MKPSTMKHRHTKTHGHTMIQMPLALGKEALGDKEKVSRKVELSENVFLAISNYSRQTRACSEISISCL